MSVTKFTSRTRARKRAIDVIFEADQKGFVHQGEHVHGLLQKRVTVSTAQVPMNDFSQTLVAGVADHIDDIDDMIIRFVRGSTLSRLPATDRAILRVATYEILFHDDTDTPVVIAEAIRIAEAIGGTDKSPAFIHAVLDHIDDASTAVALSDDEGDSLETLPICDSAGYTDRDDSGGANSGSNEQVPSFNNRDESRPSADKTPVDKDQDCTGDQVSPYHDSDYIRSDNCAVDGDD